MKTPNKHIPTSPKPIPNLNPALKELIEKVKPKEKPKLTITPKPTTAIKPSFNAKKLRGH